MTDVYKQRTYNSTCQCRKFGRKEHMSLFNYLHLGKRWGEQTVLCVTTSQGTKA